MKVHRFFPALLLCASLSLQAVEERFVFEAGVVYLVPDVDQTTTEYFAEQLGVTNFEGDLDGSAGASIFTGIQIDFITLGFEVLTFNTGIETSESTSITSSEASNINSALGTSFSSGSIRGGFEEKYFGVSFIPQIRAEHALSESLSVYAAAGAGVTRITQELGASISQGSKSFSYSIEDTKSAFTYTFEVALKYAFTENVYAFGGFKMIGTQDVKFTHDELNLKLSGEDIFAYGGRSGIGFSF